jgi:hypothetical protein
VLGRVDEGVDDENLGPVLLGDLVDLGVSAALDEEGLARPLTQDLEPVEEVGDQDDLVILDSLKGQVALDGPLVAGSLRAERDHGDSVACLASRHSGQAS